MSQTDPAVDDHRRYSWK